MSKHDLTDLQKRLRLYVKQYYDFQETRKGFDNRVDRYWDNHSEYPEQVNKLLQKSETFEDDVEVMIEDIISDFPLYSDWMEDVKGIGPVMAANVLSRLCLPRQGSKVHKRDNLEPMSYWTIEEETSDYYIISTPPKVEVAEKVSQLWSLCGLTPDSNRKQGECLSYDPKLKELFAYKIPTQFAKADHPSNPSKFKEIYDNKTDELYRNRDDIEKQGHARGIARTITGKIFCSHVWMMYRDRHDLRIPEFYIADSNGHHNIIKPFTDDGDIVRFDIEFD